jgi:hypothetical protein
MRMVFATEEIFNIFPASPCADGQDYYNNLMIKERITLGNQFIRLI